MIGAFLVLTLFTVIDAFPSAQNPFAAGPSILNNTVTTPCSVTLFENFSFATYDEYYTFPYVPPSGDCLGPWDRVILRIQASVNGTVQFDRTGAIWLDQVEILRFTTPEPPGMPIEWNVQRDLSVYGPYFQEGHTVYASCQNVVNPTYNGVIRMTATLYFYYNDNDNDVEPVEKADYVMGINRKAGGFQDLTLKSSEILNSTFKLPFRNANKVYMDMYASGHSCEEFWYSNAPGALANYTGCGGGSNRQFRVTLDNRVAGIQTPFPVVYTGGINPLFWRPQTGISSFNIPPYRFDLTPFVGLLNDGQEHTIGITVLNNTDQGFWYITPVLVLWQNQGEERIDSGTVSISYDFTGVTNITRSGQTLGWLQTYKAGLIVTSELRGSTSGNTTFASISSTINFTNQNTLDIVSNKQVTNMLVNTKIASSAFDRNLSYVYPFYTSIKSSSNDTGFSILSDIEYSVEKNSSAFSSGSTILTYENSMTSEAYYSKNLVNGTQILVQEGSTSQIFNITTSTVSQDTVCFSQRIETAGGYVIDEPTLFVGDCIPTTFCADFDACADPEDVVYPVNEPPQLGEPPELPPLHRCPHLLQCPGFNHTLPGTSDPVPTSMPPNTAPTVNPSLAPTPLVGSPGAQTTSSSAAATLLLSNRIWKVLGFSLTTLHLGA